MTRREGQVGENGDEPHASSTTEDVDARRGDSCPHHLGSNPRRAWKLSEIVHESQARGWGSDSQYEDHLVLRTLSNMLKAGQVKRPKKGYYKLVPPRPGAPAQEAKEGG